MESNNFKIVSNIEIQFNNKELRDISYNSFIPEISQIPRKRTSLIVEKVKKSLIFKLKASDFTAFRAAISDIVNFGKIIEKNLNLIK